MSVQKRMLKGTNGIQATLSEVAQTPTVMSLCFAILIYELYGALTHEHQEWGKVIMASQDPSTGLFIDPILSGEDLLPTSPGKDYLVYQTTYFAVNALDALRLRPIYPLKYIEPFYDTTWLETWMRNRDWCNPWRESNWIMFIATSLFATFLQNGSNRAIDSLQMMLDWLDLHQDTETGLWGTQHGASLLHGMATAYHFIPYYYCLRRPVNHWEQLIESTLGLQQPDGLFHPDGGGDSCLDVDAVDILVKSSMMTNHLIDNVEKALDLAFYAILDNRDENGGFCRARNRPHPPKRLKRKIVEIFKMDRLLRKSSNPSQHISFYSGWKMMPFDIRQGDLFSTMFRSFGLALISTRFPQKFPSANDWRFRRIPALVWHDQSIIIEMLKM